MRNIGWITILFCCFSGIAFAESVATVVEVEGRVETRVNNQQWSSATVNDSLSGGDEIQTYEGKSSLILSDESMLKLNRNTYMQMQSVSQTAAWQNQQGLFNAASPTLKSIYRLFKGEAWLRNNNREVDIDIETPTVTASLRGTELHIEIVSPELVNITVLEGAVLASNAAGSIQAVAGELIIAPLGQAPRKQTLLTPQDSVQWTVRVPNLIQQQDWMAATAGNVQQQDIAAIVQDLSLQNIQAAQNKLTQLESQSGQPLGSLAGLVALSAGEHEQARQVFTRVSETSENDVVALRGLALSSLLTNKKTQAIAAAERAVNASAGGTSTDWLLLSYMQRADFDLESAETSASKALELDSNNILALNGLALLQFADDRISAARDTIGDALAIDEADSLSHSLLGFLRLSERDQIGAKQSFTTALVHDPANSEAHLGLSLWAQREGDAEQAQKSLATAIALDPQRSLYLSYWAKVLHQEQRFDKALTVLDTAARLDSQDPTPHYYRAIIERDLFRAGEAITSLETAIDLNDKRAVYRSRLLLDQDIAARNINLATIYDGLGMDLLATQKAVQSTLDDYRNFSAHLFLSSALTQEGRTFPADSAVLVSGLLFPANANALSTINDYTVFFEQPELDSNVTLSVGSNGLIDASAFLGGVAPQTDMSYALGARTQNVDSFNGLNETERQQLSGTLKWQTGGKNTYRARFNLTETDTDLGMFEQLDQGFAFAGGRNDQTALFAEIGLRRELSNRSDLLINLEYVDTDSTNSATGIFIDPTFMNLPIVAEQTGRGARETLQLQTQYSLALEQHQLNVGFVHLDGENLTDARVSSEIIDVEDFFGPDEAAIRELELENRDLANSVRRETDLRFSSIYIDDVWKVAENLSLHSGLYAEDFDNDTTDEFEINPRLGVIWQPTTQDTIRLAGFRYLLPQVQGRLHPTHSAGVFITRNTEEGALVEELNLVWERNWNGGILRSNLFDLERRNREQLLVDGPETLERSSLRGASIGVNQQLGNRFGIAANLALSEIRDDQLLLQTERDEVNASVVLSYISPRRISARASQSFRQIDFLESGLDTENISITDIELGYTFADRRGSISLSVNNLFDEEFVAVVDSFTINRFRPEREYRATLSWNF